MFEKQARALRVGGPVLTVGSLWIFLLLAGCQPGTTPSGLEVANPRDGIWQDAEKAPVRLVLEQVFADDESEPRGLLSGGFYVAVDAAGSVYATDMFAGRIVSFSSDGAFRWEVNAPGNGPGEIRNPGPLFFLPPDTLLFSNQDEREEWFSTNGRHLGSKSLEPYGRGHILGVLQNSDRIFRKGIAGAAAAHVTIFAESLRDTFTVQGADLDVFPGLHVPPPVSAYGNSVVVKHLARYAYTFYQPDGALARIVSRDIPIQAPHIRQIPGGVQMQNWTLMYGPLPLADGMWLGGGRWPTDLNDPEEYASLRDAGAAPELTMHHSLDLFSEEGTLLYSVGADVLDQLEIDRPLATDDAGKLYVRMTTGPYIGRYRVEVTPPS